MLAAIPGFFCIVEACRKKSQTVFKSYKENKLANLVSENNRHECKFYDSLDQWWHQAGSVIKHMSATTMNSTNSDAQDNYDDANQDISQDIQIECSSQSEPPSVSNKNKFQDQTLFYFEKIVDNGTAMLDHFAKTNELLQKVDHQMDWLINKL